MSNTLILSLAIGGYQHLFRSCLDSQYAYSLKNSYDYAVVTTSPWLLTAHDAAWLKVPLLIAASQLKYEFIMFIDADCEVRLFAQSIQSIFQEGKSLYLAPGISGRINSGVIIAKNRDEQVRYTFQKILDNADSYILPENEAPYENGHFIQYIKDCDFVGTIEHQKWNNNSKLNPNSFIQHYSGKALREHYNNSYVNNYQKLKFKVDKYIGKFSKHVPQYFLNETSKKKRIEILIDAYSMPLESVIIQSIR
ncbi:hypothetical protein NIES2100_16080 [Calothrix sp. NIES-2100]|uniref:hypothetical protein n=1 Tax=Calothrix sp. NIES-2100 TaxID=1954172 RepID=UPI000B5FA2B5|nr:hypothetical protein NIES2100_16080 [Calothrix sp. NIES-2100]